jgi:hypothetical protein
MNKKAIGDAAEKFVADYLSNLGYKCEIHPRTHKVVHLPHNKTIVVSQDNDYHNSFDVKAEGPDCMIYAQVKFMPDGTVSSGHISHAKRNIDKNYPYNFTYQKIQVWMVWKEWVKEPHRHREFKVRVWERRGYDEKVVSGIHKIVGRWEEINLNELILSEAVNE